MKFFKAYRDCVPCSDYNRRVAMDLEEGESKRSGHDVCMLLQVYIEGNFLLKFCLCVFQRTGFLCYNYFHYLPTHIVSNSDFCLGS